MHRSVIRSADHLPEAALCKARKLSCRLSSENSKRKTNTKVYLTPQVGGKEPTPALKALMEMGPEDARAVLAISSPSAAQTQLRNCNSTADVYGRWNRAAVKALAQIDCMEPAAFAAPVTHPASTTPETCFDFLLRWLIVHSALHLGEITALARSKKYPLPHPLAPIQNIEPVATVGITW